MAWLQDRKRGSVGSLQPKYDSDGSIWFYAYATSGATKKTGCQIIMGTYGWEVLALADTSDVNYLQYVGIPKATYASGSYGWYQIGGYASDCIISTTTGTVGHAVLRATNTIVTGGANPTGDDNEFGVFQTTGSTATYDILLFPVRIDGAD